MQDFSKDNQMQSYINSSIKHSLSQQCSQLPVTLKSVCSVYVKIIDQENVEGEYIQYIIEVSVDNQTWLNDYNMDALYTVTRRYSDFDQFRNTISALYPHCLVPPLPPKLRSWRPWKVVGQQKDTRFIECRKTGLERFLWRVLAHQQLSREDLVRRFLTEGDAWKHGLQDNNITSKIGKYIKQKVDYRAITSKISSSKESRDSRTFSGGTSELSFDDSVQRIPGDPLVIVRSLADQLRKGFDGLMKGIEDAEHNEVAVHKLSKNQGDSICDWCGLERSTLGDCLQAYGHHMDSFSNMVDNKQIADESLELEVLLVEYFHFADSLDELAQRYSHGQQVLDAQHSGLQNTRRHLLKLQSEPLVSTIRSRLTGQPSTEEERQKQISRTKQLLEDAETGVDSTQSFMQTFQSSMDAEIARFDKEKKIDLNHILLKFATFQLNKAEEALHLWTKMNAVISADG